MNRFLQYFNLLGVVALAALCAVQWQANRRVNLESSALEKTRLEQTAKIVEGEKALHGVQADLDGFRGQLSRASTSLQEASDKLRVAERQVADLTAERDQLRVSVTNWSAAVTARDERLKANAEQLQKLATERNDSVTKFNELAGKYNSVVKDLNELRTKVAALTAPPATNAGKNSGDNGDK
jgi:chromosome segregation ATPase